MAENYKIPPSERSHRLPREGQNVCFSLKIYMVRAITIFREPFGVAWLPSSWDDGMIWLKSSQGWDDFATERIDFDPGGPGQT